MSETPTFPRLRQTVLDTTSARHLAEFYRQLLGFDYESGDEAPAPGAPDDADWLALVEPGGRRVLAFQQVDKVDSPTWPDGPVPQQLHLDFSVESADELRRQKARALELGATLLRDRFDDPDEPLFVFADPSGHPFCIFVS
ncbi:VOC family protein [Gryllotalpicola reticulitermitis]|uniref:VOC family protein n=1 Tax=Gryllotalpicola reticulitermitis TaxID=1184153 RepID=A0ABV8QAT0_9MICO